MYDVVNMKIVESGRHLGQEHDYVFLFALSVKDVLFQVAEGIDWCDLVNGRNYFLLVS